MAGSGRVKLELTPCYEGILLQIVHVKKKIKSSKMATQVQAFLESSFLHYVVYAKSILSTALLRLSSPSPVDPNRT